MKVLIPCALVWTMDLAPFEDAGSDLAQNSLFYCCGTSKMTYEPIFGLVDSRPSPSTNKRRCVVFVTQVVRINPNQLQSPRFRWGQLFSKEEEIK